MVRIAREIGRDVATGEEAKRIYKIGTYYKNADEALAQLAGRRTASQVSAASLWAPGARETRQTK